MTSRAGVDLQARATKHAGAAPHAGASSSRPPWTADQFKVPPAEGKTRFHDLNLPVELMHAIADLNFPYCTPVQALALPPALEGKDVAGRAQTGTGKTAAFLIAIFTHFLRHPLPKSPGNGTPRALILAPTRELAIQIHKDALSLGKYCPFHVAVVYGGMDYRKQQMELAQNRIDLVVATPGRLLDFKSKGVLHLNRAEILIVDEADRMLDMGFIPDVRRIVYSLPPKHRRQTMLFSATLTEDIMRLASAWMVDPVMVTVENEKVTVDAIDQKVYMVSARDKLALLISVLRNEPVERVLVFRNRRDGVDRLTRKLTDYGIPCAPLSGDVPQDKRLRILEAFRAGRIKVVIATDVAGRGIHVEGISHVINYDVPYEAEDYVHRIGRTGRAGALGTAITFACEEGSFNMPAIETFIGRKLPYTQPEMAWLALPPLPKTISPVAADNGPSVPVPRRPSDRHGRPPSRGGFRRSGSRR
ncbi:MAG: DEAD/DEAH box helicase [Kiritimatiellae bacterium]|nr:DEAD/DEAH box helicase [Kiritimatiellia bacterium]